MTSASKKDRNSSPSKGDDKDSKMKGGVVATTTTPEMKGREKLDFLLK